MLEDAKAFGIGSTIVGTMQFFIGASSIAVLNFAAQKQVIETQRYFGRLFRQICKKYTGCNRRNGPDFGRVFLILNYTEKPQNTYIQS